MYPFNVVEELGKTHIFVVSKSGWYLWKVIKICFSKEDAIKEWEKITDISYSEKNYKQYLDRIPPETNYYSIDELELKKVINDFVKIRQEQAISDKADEIAKTADNILKNDIKYQLQKEYSKVFGGMLWYLRKNGIDDDELENGKNFFENFVKTLDK